MEEGVPDLLRQDPFQEKIDTDKFSKLHSILITSRLLTSPKNEKENSRLFSV